MVYLRRRERAVALGRWRGGLAGIGLALSLAVAWGVAAPLGAQSHATRIYTEDDGLAGSRVLDVEQGPDGRMWFATRAGISVFDGARWKTYGPESGLPSTNYFRLSIERDGTVWAASDITSEVYRFDGRRWHGLPRPSSQTWRVEDHVDFDVAGPPSEPVPVVATAFGLFLFRDGSWQKVTVEGGIRGLQGDEEGVWLVGAAGLFRFELDGGLRSVELELPPGVSRMPEPTALYVSADGDFLLAGSDWVGALWHGRLRITHSDLPLLSAAPGWVRLISDGRGGAYVADRERIFHLDTDGSVTRLGLETGLAESGAHALFLGLRDVLWVAGSRGVTKIVSRRMTSFREEDGLLEDEVTSVLQLRDGAVLVGHNRGITRIEGSTAVAVFEFPTEADTPASHFRVMDLEQTPDGTVWVATNREGLWQIPPTGLEDAGPVAESSAPRDVLSSLAYSPEEGLWVGGLDLYRYDDGRFFRVPLPRPADPRAQRIRRLCLDGGNLYVATTHHGLVVRERDGWRLIQAPKGRPNPSFYAVEVDSEDRVWLGAAEGLFRVVDGEIRPASRPRVRRPVYSLREDSAGRLWIGTDRGVMRFDRGGMRVYGAREGLVGYETNRDALTPDDRGRMWIGTDRGVSRYDERFDAEVPPPRPELVALEVSGEPMSLDAPLDLSWNQNNLKLSFRAVSFLEDDGVEYSGRLEGFDEEFLPPERAFGRAIYYTNLPAGRYRFSVRARHGDGAWSESRWSEPAVSPWIRIRRPFWSSGWFFALVALCGLLVVLAGSRHWAARRHARLLEAEVRDRTRELETSNRRLRDEITEHRATETQLRGAKIAAEQASLAKSQFLAVMSHEIRTPMTGVLGSVELLQQSGLDPAQQQQVTTLRRSGEALLAILDDILDYSRIEADRLEVEEYVFDLRGVLDDVAALFGPEASKKGVALELEVAPGVPERVVGDGSRLRQVVVNLVGNAVKFTDRGRVEIRCETAGEDPLEARIEVHDTGIGISAEALEKLFEPFQQVDSSVRRRHGGTGLGLAISRRLAQAMGGELEAAGTPGEGSVFTVIVPLRRADAAAEEEEERLPVLGRPLRILVAEDNPIVQAIHLEMLETLGLEPDLAENGVEALDLLDEGGEYDVVLLDVQMPVLDGLETARRIVAQNGDRRPVLIGVTAHASQEDREQCLAAGMDDYLAKPVSLRALGEKLGEWADRPLQPKK